MAKTQKISWTGKQKEVAELLRQGKTPKDIIASGYTQNLVYKVRRALKDDGKKQTDKPLMQPPPPPGSSSRPETTHPDPAFVTKYRIGSLEPQTLGEIQALPEDWRISQHGVFLLLDTYYLTKEEIGYEGTMGEFITDIAQLYRAMMQYTPLPEVGLPLPEAIITEGEADDGTATIEGAESPGQNAS